MTETAGDTVSVTVDGRPIAARPGELVIAAAERHGTYIPRFCYHPRMSSVGMCRMCLVEVDTGRGPALQPSCMIAVSEGMIVDTESDVTRRAQEGILELLLVNHPLDCPVCDKGGECPLQDQTMAFGPGETRFVEQKRNFEKPIPISELVFLDRERCILCDRCTRFADEVAGDPLIHFTDRGYQTQVMTFPDDPFSSYFSGNTVQICPVGALTAKPYRFKARPWDLDETESTCTTCSVGCRMAIQSSRNELVRYLGVDSDAVNWGWLCDRGRFDFEAVNSDDRLPMPLVRNPDDDAELIGASWTMALDRAADVLRGAIAAGGAGSVAVLGGARLTNEAAYAWAKLAKGVIGTDHVDAQLGDGLAAEAVLGLPRATIDDACSATTVITLGPDLKEELPVLYLRLRAAATDGHVEIIEVTPVDTGLTPYANRTVHHLPGNSVAEVAELLGDEELVGRLAAGDVVIAVGRPSLAGGDDDVLESIGLLRDALPEATYLPVLRRGNVFGALDMGLAPGLLPGRIGLEAGREWYGRHWPNVPETRGLDAAGILEAAASGRVGALVLLGADPLGDFPDRDLAERALAGAGAIIAVDIFPTASVKRADVVLAAATFGEQPGTTTNLEGRVSRLREQITPPGTARTDWSIAVDLATRLDGDLALPSVAATWDEISVVAPSHRGCTLATIDGAPGHDGVVLPLSGRAQGLSVSSEATDVADDVATGVADDAATDDGAAAVPPAVEPPPPVTWVAPSPSQVNVPNAYSYRLVVGRTLWDAATSVAMSPSLTGLAPPPVIRLNPTDFQRLGVDGGERVHVEGRGRVSLDVVARPDSRVPRGVAALAFRPPGLATSELITAGQRFTEVRIESR